jgi:hypothetical protein
MDPNVVFEGDALEAEPATPTPGSVMSLMMASNANSPKLRPKSEGADILVAEGHEDLAYIEAGGRERHVGCAPWVDCRFGLPPSLLAMPG